MKSASSIVVHAKLSSLQFTFDQFSLVIPVTVATRASPATLLSVERCKRNDLIVKDASNFLFMLKMVLIFKATFFSGER
jgi:hypothetical protein